MDVSGEDIDYMSFFFVDIVGLSDPSFSTNTQVNKIRTLNNLISECPTFANTERNQMIVLPTGDGMAIGFRKALEKPVLLARELHYKLNEYNRDKSENEILGVRIGCNDGHIFLVNDIYGNMNFWGPGIILARRVMDLGEAGHILMPSSMAESLLELSDTYREMIHPIHDYEIKHGQKMLLYSAYGKNFGNSARPSKGIIIETSGSRKKIPRLSEEIMEGLSYKKIELHCVLIKPDLRLIGYRRTCHIRNNTNEPIFVLNEALTIIGKSISDINLRLYDEDSNELKLSGVVSDAEDKIFIVKLNQPILSGEGNRLYTVAYEAEEAEKYVSETFATGCQDLAVTFEYPADIMIEPRLLLIRNREQYAIDKDVMVRSSGKYIVRWKKLHAVRKGDGVRLEW